MATNQPAPAETQAALDNTAQPNAAILQAALEEFASVGFDGATMRSIASRCGFTHGNIRHHFETKEKLWFAAADFLFARLHAEIDLNENEAKRLSDGNLEVFKAWLRRYVGYCARYPEHARFMMQVSTAPSARLTDLIDRHVRKDHQAIRTMFVRLIELGLFPAGTPPESALYMIAGACQNIFALSNEAQLALDYDTLSEPAINAHADLLIDVFCRPRTPERGQKH